MMDESLRAWGKGPELSACDRMYCHAPVKYVLQTSSAFNYVQAGIYNPTTSEKAPISPA